MAANDRQVGGTHYKKEGIPEHWDLAIMYRWDFFQYQITKYIMRWKDKGGVEDLKKAAHFLEKYIESSEKFILAHMAQRTVEPDIEYYKKMQDISALFVFEGQWGDGIALYTCKQCGEKVKADNPITAYRLHGECPTKAYVNQD